MGEGGMDPRYFAHTLTFFEARLFLNGLQRRRQAAWEVARYQAFYSAAPHCKNFKFEDLGRFPWEERGEPEMNEEEELKALAELRERAALLDSKILERKGENGKRKNR